MFYLAEGQHHDPQKAKLYFQKNIAHYRENEYRFKDADKYGFRFNYAVALSRTAALVINQKGSLDEAYAHAEAAAVMLKKLYLQHDPASAFFHLCDSYKIFSSICLRYGESHYPKAKAVLDELLQIIRSFAEKNPGLRITEEYADTLIYYARTPLLQPEKEIEVLQAAISLLKKLFSVRKDSKYLVKIDQCNAKIASTKNSQADRPSSSTFSTSPGMRLSWAYSKVIAPPSSTDTKRYSALSRSSERHRSRLPIIATAQRATQTSISNKKAGTLPTVKNSTATAYIPTSAEASIPRQRESGRCSKRAHK
jgi:tetratricopeptide (TPR) repeat protein